LLEGPRGFFLCALRFRPGWVRLEAFERPSDPRMLRRSVVAGLVGKPMSSGFEEKSSLLGANLGFPDNDRAANAETVGAASQHDVIET
jgi:hypothetical protein